MTLSFLVSELQIRMGISEIADMDGVLWRGGKTIDGAPETLKFLSELKKKIFFATNNSTSTRLEVRRPSKVRFTPHPVR